MRFTLFQYTLPAPAELEDLNAFLAGQRVAAVTHHLLATPGGGLLVFVVETVGSPPQRTSPSSNQLRIDYRERLSADEFLAFSQLREERKRWGEMEGVPVYAIFTNAQLAEMVKRRVRTPAELAAIEGVGRARIEKYGARLIAILADLAAPNAGAEAGETP